MDMTYDMTFFDQPNWVEHVGADKLLAFADWCKDRISAPSAQEKFVGHIERMKDDNSHPGLRNYINEPRQVTLRETVKGFLKPSKKRQAPV